jgi:hypothetical protein
LGRAAYAAIAVLFVANVVALSAVFLLSLFVVSVVVALLQSTFQVQIPPFASLLVALGISWVVNRFVAGPLIARLMVRWLPHLAAGPQR